MKKNYKKMSNRIKEKRQALGMTQAELARKCECSRNTIVAIENNKFCPSVFLALILSKVLNETIESLFKIETTHGEEDKKGDLV